MPIAERRVFLMSRGIPRVAELPDPIDTQSSRGEKIIARQFVEADIGIAGLLPPPDSYQSYRRCKRGAHVAEARRCSSKYSTLGIGHQPTATTTAVMK